MTESKSIRSVMSRLEFFQVCQVLQRHKQWFLDSRPTLKEAGKKLEELANLPSKAPIPPKSVREIQKATGITWEPKIHRQSEGKYSQRFESVETALVKTMERLSRIEHQLADTALALRALYRKLDEVPPARFDVTFRELFPDDDPTPRNDAPQTKVVPTVRG